MNHVQEDPTTEWTGSNENVVSQVWTMRIWYFQAFPYVIDHLARSISGRPFPPATMNILRIKIKLKYHEKRALIPFYPDEGKWPEWMH